MENSDEEIGPALPGEEMRRPTEEALLQVMQKKREASEKSDDGKKLVWFVGRVKQRSAASG